MHQTILHSICSIFHILGGYDMNLLEYVLDLDDASVWNIISTTGEAKASLLFMQENGDFIARKGYFTTRDGQGSFLIKLTLSGQGVLKYRGQEYCLKPGDLFFIDCKQWQHYGTDSDYGSWRVIWVYFNGVTAETYYKLFLKYTNGKNVISVPHSSSIHNLMSRLLQFYDGDIIDHLKTDIRCAELLVQLLTECIMIASSDQALSLPSTVQEIRSYLDENYAKRITLDDLANQFFLSPCYIQKIFKRYTNQSPTEYLIYLRIAKAKELMRSTHLPLNEVALAVGIDSYSYFIRLFKKYEGMTPREYQSAWPTA